jgi:hypothetical protein
VAGLKDLSSILNPQPFREVLKAALPLRSQYIDSQPLAAFHLLLDELQEVILKELRLMLEGSDIDQDEITPALKITQAVKKAQSESEKLGANSQAGLA